MGIGFVRAICGTFTLCRSIGEVIMNKSRNAFVRLIISVIVLVMLCLVGIVRLWLVLRISDIDIPIGIYYAGIVLILLVAIAIIWQCISIVEHLKYTDTLTGIGNGEYVVRKGGALFYRKKLIGFTAIFLNIVDCKVINDRVTNTGGDTVISKFANHLKDYLDKGNKGIIGRMGGDNFFLFVKDEYLEEFLEIIRDVYIEVEAKGKLNKVHVKARAGVEKVKTEDNYRDIINYCTSALAKAKKEKKDFVIFEDEMYEQQIYNKKILAEYKVGLKNKEFLPFYQPKVEATSGKLCGGEALVRWKKNGKIISPAYFVPALEEEGEIVNLDFYIFEYVCQDIRKWIDAGINPVRISSNFSKLHLRDDNFAERIIAIKNKYNIDSKYIEIELTESTGSEDLEALKEFSKKIKSEGIYIAIDDFGTGYSSLSMLRNFEADVIKLDKSFLDSAADGDSRSRLFIKDIIHMIDNQEESILCEGVETKEQLTFLKESGCHIIQGYYFDKPLEREIFSERLKNPMYV